MPFTSAARSKRRCAPVNSASTRSASARGTSTASRAASAHAAFRRLCSPGTASLKSTGSRSRPQITVSIPARPGLEGLRELGVRAEGRVVVELDVRHDSDRRGKCEDASVRLVSLDDEPAAPGPGVAAELRDLTADEERRVAAEPVEHEGDHRGGRRLAMCASDDDGVGEADELGEELGARRALHPPGEGGRDERLRVGRSARAGRPRSPRGFRRRARLRGTGSRAGPSRSRPHPTPSRGSRSRSSRRRRFPPARSSGR